MVNHWQRHYFKRPWSVLPCWECVSWSRRSTVKFANATGAPQSNLTEPPRRRDRQQKVREAAFGVPISSHPNQSGLVDDRPVEEGV